MHTGHDFTELQQLDESLLEWTRCRDPEHQLLVPCLMPKVSE